MDGTLIGCVNSGDWVNQGQSRVLCLSVSLHICQVSDGGPQHLRARCPLLSEVQVKQLFSPQSAASDRLFGLFFSEMVLVLPWTPTVPAYQGGTHPTFRNPLIVCALWVVTDKWGCYISTVVHSQKWKKKLLVKCTLSGHSTVWRTTILHSVEHFRAAWSKQRSRTVGRTTEALEDLLSKQGWCMW